VDERDLGWVTGSSQGFFVAHDPDRVLSPDVAFTSYARLPHPPQRGFFPCAPEFAVEVRSPDDSWISVVEKAGVWIGHRGPVVWAVDPGHRVVVTLRPGVVPVEVRAGTVDAEPVLPGFRISVSDLFYRL
jgi:Uma2 family endonuclease